MKKIEKYIFESHKRRVFNEYFLFHNIQVIEQDPLPENIDLQNVLSFIEKRIPQHFLDALESVYIGDFGFVAEKGFNALYEDGTIYILDVQDNEEDLLDDFIHEIGHAFENLYALDLYGDGVIESEFLGKRRKLLDILSSLGYNVDSKQFMNCEYDEDFDAFLYQEVGYPKLQTLTNGLFVSPYGATSLREYFANGFEEIFARNGFSLVSNVSPVVASKIERLM